MGQGGMRVNMVPKDGGNTVRGNITANFAGKSFASKNLRSNLAGDLTRPATWSLRSGRRSRWWSTTQTTRADITNWA